MYRRARNVNITLFGIRAHQSIKISRFKLVGFFGQRFGIADAKVAGAGAESVAEGERAERCVSSSTPAGDHQSVTVSFALRNEKARAIDAIINVHNSPVVV